MRKMILVLSATVLTAAIANAMPVVETTYTVGPEDLVEQSEFTTSMFGYDWDDGKPIGVNEAGPAGFGPSCFWSDVQGSAAGGPRDYTSVRLNPSVIFGGPVTIADLDRIAFYTKNNAVGERDWQYKIYTEGTVAWYGHRFNGVVPNAADTDWHLWDSDTNMPVGDIYDPVAGSYVTVPGTGSFDDVSGTYGSETILFIDIIAGFATNSPPVDSYLDGVQISALGQEVTMDLVPEPASLSLLALAGLAMFRRR